MNRHTPRRSGVGSRQVLKPGTRNAARHPWANMLHAARTGGVTVSPAEIGGMGGVPKTTTSGATTYTITRDVTPEECWWLAETVPAGSVVYRCTKPTYGAVKNFAATRDEEGGYPFFELPYDAIKQVTP